MSDSDTIAMVRRLIGDEPRWVMDETVGIGNGARVAYQLAAYPVVGNQLQVWVDGVDATADVTLDAALGLIVFDDAPAAEAVIAANYTAASLTDAAIGSQLDAVNQNVLLAAARCLEVLLLDPASTTALRFDGVSLDPAARRSALQALIERYRQQGSYAQFQVRVDAPEWEDA